MKISKKFQMEKPNFEESISRRKFLFSIFLTRIRQKHQELRQVCLHLHIMLEKELRKFSKFILE